MKRIHFVLLGIVLVLLAAFVFSAEQSVSVAYGSERSVLLELNRGDVAYLAVTVTSIPDANVATMFVSPDAPLSDRVFCAPSPKGIVATSADFTCVITPGDPVEGYVTFVALDENGNVLSTSTRLHLTVTYKDVWFSAKAVAKIGSTISVGGHTVEVKKASFIYATLSVDGSPFTVFVNDETSVASDLKVVYKGYDPDAREVFFEFRSTRPITASVSTPSYYLVVPSTVYLGEGNTAEVDVYTSCSAVEYRRKGSQDWMEVSVSDGRATISVDANVDRIYVRCIDDPELSRAVHIKPPVVIEKTVELNDEQLSARCLDLGFIRESQCPKQDCDAYCVSQGFVKPPAGYECRFVKPGSEVDWRVVAGIVILIVIGALAYLQRTGRIRLSQKAEGFTTEKKAEPAHDVE